MMTQAAATEYVPLWCKSNYSFLEGASSPEQYVNRASKLGLKSIALTDRNGIYGVVKAYQAALECNTQLIIGSEISVRDKDGTVFSIVLLVQNHQGYSNLCTLISRGQMRCNKGKSEVTVNECCQYSKGLYALWLPQATAVLCKSSIVTNLEIMHEAFGERFFLVISRHLEPQEPLLEIHTRKYAHCFGIATVAALEILYHSSKQRPVQDILNCIQSKQSLSNCEKLLKPNARHQLIRADDFWNIFSDDHLSVEASVRIAYCCRFELREIHYTYPEERQSQQESADQQLDHLTWSGAFKRYGNQIPQAIDKQIKKELQLIQELGYSSYFLTMHRIVKWCRRHNILCQGRGSAANSAVCYCLLITHIDPVSMDLLFERFLSRERNEPPDIDLDIEHKRREEVIQHVYATYGRDHAAMVAVVVRYRIRSAVRDVGMALDIPELELQRIAKQLNSHGILTHQHLVNAGLDPTLYTYRLLLKLSNTIIDFPRHLSIHPGGFVFTTGSIYEMVPVENATMPERTVIQWEKDDIEMMRIFKVDLLGLGALSQLHQCFDMIAKHRGTHLDMHSIPKDDAQVFEMLCKADTVGVFQIESRAQMSMLPRLKPQRWYDLVVQIAIVRPGPISGGMVHPYLQRREGKEPIVYPHPCLKAVLEKTLGIPIFQEQVIKLAMLVADYQSGEADQLRRDMAAWRSSDRIKRHRNKFISRMTAKGINPKFAEQVYEQIKGFGEYGFPESHSASFALIAYATSYLKYHYPAEFACSLLNSQPMGFYSPATIVEDARRHGVQIAPVDIRYSQIDCTVEPSNKSVGGFALRIGLRYVKGISKRDLNVLQELTGTENFAQELSTGTELSKNALQKLAQAGALRELAPNRRTALWEVGGIKPQGELLKSNNSIEFSLLEPEESTTWDYESTGISNSGHILQYYRKQLREDGLLSAKQINSMTNGCKVRYVGCVICRQRPKSASNVVFMTLEDETGIVNLVFWPHCFERYSVLAKTLSLLGVEGKLQVASGVTHLIVEHVWQPYQAIGWKKFESRDFH